MTFSDLPWVGVALATLVFFALGAVWYGPLFGRTWRRLIGVPADAAPATPELRTMFGSFLSTLLGVIALATILGSDVPATEGLLTGMAVGAFIATTALATQYLFESRPALLLAINGAFNIVGFGLAGLIISAFA